MHVHTHVHRLMCMACASPHVYGTQALFHGHADATADTLASNAEKAMTKPAFFAFLSKEQVTSSGVITPIDPGVK